MALGVGSGEALARLKANYDGYRFNDGSPDIYNPFSLLNTFARGRIDSCWFGSGTPTTLINLLQKSSWEIGDLEGREADEDEFDTPVEDMPAPLPMLYQAGCLTIKSHGPLTCSYTPGIPNAKVARGLSKSLVRHAAGAQVGEFNDLAHNISRNLRAQNMEGTLKAAKAFMAGVPYHLGSHSARGFQAMF